MTASETPEFSRVKRSSEIGSSTDKASITANDDECAALAKRFDLRAIESLDAEYKLLVSGDNIRFNGRIASNLTQICALSGQDLPVVIDETFDILFMPATAASTEEEEEIELTAEDCDVIEYDGKQIDLGEAVAQSLYLSLDPYARAPDAEEMARKQGLKSEEEAGPFGALAALKDKLG